MNWSNVQIQLFDPAHLGKHVLRRQWPNLRGQGVELQVVRAWRRGLPYRDRAHGNSSNQTNAPCLSSNRPVATNPNARVPAFTQINGQPVHESVRRVGTFAAYSRPCSLTCGALRHGYGEYRPFVSAGANHVGTMRNEPASYPNGNSPTQNPPTSSLLLYAMPGYTTYDAAIGVGKDNWTVQATGNNLSNSNASTNTSSGQFIKMEVPLRRAC